MMREHIACQKCAKVYDPQVPGCPECGHPTFLTRWALDLSATPPSGISPRAWRWGFAAAIPLWLIIAGVIAYLTADG